MPHITQEQMPWEVLAIAELLRQNPEGETLSYAAMSEVAGGVDVQKVRPEWQRTARAIVLDEGIDYAPVRNVGVKRNLPGDALKCGESGRKSIQRSVRRTGKRLSKINPARLASEQNIQRTAYLAMLALIQATTALKTIKHYAETGHLPKIVPLTPGQLEGMFRQREQ